MAKIYTTKRQRELLESAGIPHKEGRTRETADKLIDRCIELGRLPAGCREEPATESQLGLLSELLDTVPPNLTKKQASELIDRTLTERGIELRITERQFVYIQVLGGVPSWKMTRKQAGQFIEYLQDRVAGCPKCGHWYDRRRDRCEQCGGFVPRLAATRPPSHIYQPTFWEWLLSLLGF